MKTRASIKRALAKTSVLKLIENIVTMSADEEVSTEGLASSFIEALSKRLGITPMQALLLSVFVNLCDDHNIRAADLAGHFGTSITSILSVLDDIDALVKLQAIRRQKRDDGSFSYYVPQSTIDALRKDQLPEKRSVENLSISGWIECVESYFRMRRNREITDEELECLLQELLDKNPNLHTVQVLQAIHLPMPDLKLFLIMSLCFINNHDDNIQRIDIDDYFPLSELRLHCTKLEAGFHLLQLKDLVEYSIQDGHADPSAWRLTNYSKTEVFCGLYLSVSQVVQQTGLTRCEDITPKTLFFNKQVTGQVEQLKQLLQPERMTRVLDRLKSKGFRQGFTCIFYGAPGTGKTETAMQLAKASGRDVMVVDVPTIRSKWVGETEKNIKDLFNRYRELAMDNELAPILLFNEADALLNKRNEGSVNSVDKMENAMQNIILQEMEQLEGIMIATTNLTGSLDPAFERRFLYKVEFIKPTPAERCPIWKAFIPELTDADALSLAERFDFSGGQIENIARKRIISDILDDRDEVNMEGIVADCKTELLSRKSMARIGF